MFRQIVSFFLISAGRIDHGHHASKPILSLHDAVQFNKAVAKAKQLVDPSKIFENLTTSTI